MRTKKGFTLVEIVIVIGVIAVLSAVLTPTFAGVIKNSRTAAALEHAKSGYNDYMSSAYPTPSSTVLSNKDMEGLAIVVKINAKYFAYLIKNGQVVATEDLYTFEEDIQKYREFGNKLQIASLSNDCTEIWSYQYASGDDYDFLMSNLRVQKNLGSTTDYITAYELQDEQYVLSSDVIR